LTKETTENVNVRSIVYIDGRHRKRAGGGDKGTVGNVRIDLLNWSFEHHQVVFSLANEDIFA
jgi:hypothetical protein